MNLTLHSADIADGATIAARFAHPACGGENLSPALSWSGAPEGTQGFALLVHDPDAPTGGAGFWHWAVVDIPASASGIAQGAGTAAGDTLPPGSRQLRSDYGDACWGGPCPPVGDSPHRYVFTLYALKAQRLDLPADITTSRAGFMVNANTLAKASFTGYFGR